MEPSVIRHFLNPPNWFTSASIFCSTYALTLIVGEAPTPRVLATACLMVVFGGIFDLLDGRVARMTNRYSEFGVQLDSIADIVSFGVAPAMLAWAWKLHTLGSLGLLVTFWFVLCAAFRLARFNVNTSHGDWQLRGHSQGLTSTMGGGALVTLVWVANGYLEGRLNISPVVLAVIVAGIGALMVSSMPFRTFRDVRSNNRARGLLAAATAACLTGAVVLHPSMWFGVGAGLYLTVGLVDSVVTFVHFRSRGRRLPGDDEDAELALIDQKLATDEVDA